MSFNITNENIINNDDLEIVSLIREPKYITHLLGVSDLNDDSSIVSFIREHYTNPVPKYITHLLGVSDLAKIWILHTRNWVGHKQLSEYHRTPYPEKIIPVLGPLNDGKYVSFPTREEFKAYLSKTFSLNGLIEMKEKSKKINSEGIVRYLQNLKEWWSQTKQPNNMVMKFSEAF